MDDEKAVRRLPAARPLTPPPLRIPPSTHRAIHSRPGKPMSW